MKDGGGIRIRLSSLDIISHITVTCTWLPMFQINVMLPTSG